MLSRVADSLYWMSRSIERAEHTTRLLDVNLNLMLDESATNADRCWQRMLQALGNPEHIEWTGDPYALTQALTFDTENKASFRASSPLAKTHVTSANRSRRNSGRD